jgi:hypothetical protein
MAAPENDHNENWSASTVAVGTVGPDGEFDPGAEEGIEGVLGFELPPPIEKARRSRLNLVTAALVMITLAGGAFYAGVRIEKSHATSSATGNFAAAFARLGAGAPRGAGAGTGGGAGATGAGVTVGTVKLIDGKNVYVTTTSGTIVKVVIGAKSTLTVAKAGKTTDMKPGDNVVVRGAAGTDGSVAATSLSDSGTSAAIGGGFGGLGGAGLPTFGGAGG